MSVHVLITHWLSSVEKLVSPELGIRKPEETG